MDALPGYVWSASPDGRVEFCNQRCLDYTGMTLDEVRGGELTAAMHPEDKSDFEKKWRAALTHGESFETQARSEIRAYIRDPDGHLIEVGQATGILR